MNQAEFLFNRMPSAVRNIFRHCSTPGRLDYLGQTCFKDIVPQPDPSVAAEVKMLIDKHYDSFSETDVPFPSTWKF